MKNIFIALLLISSSISFGQEIPEQNLYQSTNSSNLKTRSHILNVDSSAPNKRADFYVRLQSLLDSKPEKSFEGFEFFIKDIKTKLEFSAGITGFGVGYFASNNSVETLEIINRFNDFLFNKFKDLNDCSIEMHNESGKTMLGQANGKLFETEIKN